MSPEVLKEKILELKHREDAVFLAHYYQSSDIQDISDYLGDSLYLAKMAQKVEQKTIVMLGVHFMAETAKIISPQKRVLLPDFKAGCSLADSCPPKEFQAFKDQHPNAIVVSYINCTAEIKTMTDIVCTSTNAVKIIESIPKDQEIIFAPDKNLGRYLEKITGRKLIIWPGSCVVHEAFSLEKIIKLMEQYPEAHFIAHPESEDQVLSFAHFIGSTSNLLKYVKESDAQQFIVATEAGILHEMAKQAPDKTLIPAPVEDETCACSECGFMKMNTMEKLYLCLKNGYPEINLPPLTIEKGRHSIERMLEISQCNHTTLL